MNGSPRPFFIIGSGRSGSTLLRRILCANPELHIPPETYVLGPAISLWEATEGDAWPVRVGRILDLFERHPEFETFGTSLDALNTSPGGTHHRERNCGMSSPPST